MIATLAASPCAADTAKDLCSKVANALSRCNKDKDYYGVSCFCELVPSELVKNFDVESCTAELIAMQESPRRELIGGIAIFLVNIFRSPLVLFFLYCEWAFDFDIRPFIG